ncbi:MAG: DUF4386 domain-containing protein [Candidatus Lokiarchaeota archaeon]|nr:DUF4386 domain-containing protein [Candidatus Lokiarchaeota archaeon]
MNIEIFLSGFLFLFIMVLNVAMAVFGYINSEQTLSSNAQKQNSDAELEKINKNGSKKFHISIVLALIEHGCVIVLPILLFIVFSPYNIILGVIWTISRIGEGAIQGYNEKNYWRLLNISKQYSSTSGAERKSLSELGCTIFKTKDTRFTFAMILWSIGTFAYSIVLVTYDIFPIIGWLGIIASIFIGFGNGIKLINPKFGILSLIGALLAIIFEIIIGGWLIYYSFIIL